MQCQRHDCEAVSEALNGDTKCRLHEADALNKDPPLLEMRLGLRNRQLSRWSLKRWSLKRWSMPAASNQYDHA